MQKQLKRSRSLLNGLDGFLRAYLLGPPALGFMAISLLAQPVGAQPTPPLEFLFNKAVGDQPPGPLSSDYWLRAVISEVGAGVEISLQANLVATPEAFIESVGFNLDPFAEGTNPQCAADPGICTGAPSVKPNPSKEWGYRFAEDGVSLPSQADGFDFEILLPKANDVNRLTGSEKFNIYVGGLSLGAFNATNSGKPNSLSGLYGAAKIQGYGGSATLLGGPGPDPGPTAVPGPLPILGAAAAFQASRRLRRRLKPAAVAPRPA